ncbi:MAG: hypothetical protein HS132_16010 [Planctomycetia bacterium]|nr:hypothetical protein [Planctomycetia bacterium]
MKQNYYIFNNGRLKRQENTIFFEKEDGSKVIIPLRTQKPSMPSVRLTSMKLFNYLDRKAYQCMYSTTMVIIPVATIHGNSKLQVGEAGEPLYEPSENYPAGAFIETAVSISEEPEIYGNREGVDEYISTIEGFRSQVEKTEVVES